MRIVTVEFNVKYKATDLFASFGRERDIFRKNRALKLREDAIRPKTGHVQNNRERKAPKRARGAESLVESASMGDLKTPILHSPGVLDALSLSLSRARVLQQLRRLCFPRPVLQPPSNPRRSLVGMDRFCLAFSRQR